MAIKRCLIAALAVAAFTYLLSQRPALTPAYFRTLPYLSPSQAGLPVRGELYRALTCELEGEALPDPGGGTGGFVHVLADAGRMAVVLTPADRRGASGNGSIYVFEKHSPGSGDVWVCCGMLDGNWGGLEPSAHGRPNLITHWHMGYRNVILTRYVYDRGREKYLPSETVEYEEPSP